MTTVLTAASLLTASTGFQPALTDAESCHFYGSKPACESAIVNCASLGKDTLIKAGKLDASWQTIKHDNADLVGREEGQEVEGDVQGRRCQGRARGDALYVLRVHFHRRERHRRVTS